MPQEELEREIAFLDAVDEAFQGPIRKEEIRGSLGGLHPVEIQKTLSTTVDSDLLSEYGNSEIYYYFIRLLKELKTQDPQRLHRIFKYIHKDLLEFSQLTSSDPILKERFYVRLAQLIEENSTIPQARKDLTEATHKEITQRIASLPSGSLPASLTGELENLSKFIVYPIKHKYPIDWQNLTGAFRLKIIDFSDGGNSSTSTSAIVANIVTSLPALRLEPLPIPAPVFQTLRTEDVPMDVRKGHALRAALRGAKLYKVMLRTLVYKTKTGEFIALKFLKGSRITGPQGERESTEDPGKLLYESEFFDYLNRLKEEGVPLIADYPHSLLIEGQRVIRISEKYLPVEMKDRLGLASRQAAKPNELNWPDTADGYYTLMAYTIKTPDYFTYLHEAEEEQVEEAAERNIHDLFTLARYGLIHPDIIELFHNLIQIGRTDRGHLLWMADIVRPLATRQGTGRLHAWELGTEYPNYRLSGPGDFAEMVNLNDLTTLTHPHSIYLQNNLTRFAPPEREKFILAHFMGNYTLAWALNEGRRLKRLGQLDWRAPQALAQRARWVYRTAYKAFTGEDDTEPSALIDWEEIAREMAFFMSGAYRYYGPYLELPLPLYNTVDRLDRPAISPGDGWGFIHEDVIASQLGLEGRELSKVVRYYFDTPQSTRRQIPPGIFVFKQLDFNNNLNFNELLRDEQDPVLKDKLQTLYKAYSSGWRFDGIHEDLGPVNGPFPLQELIKANYVYTMFMLAKGPQSPRPTSAADIESDARGTQALGGSL